MRTHEAVRQNGSHIMITTTRNGEYHLAIPNHNPIKIGTLNGIIPQVAKHFDTTKEQVYKNFLAKFSRIAVIVNTA